MSDMSTDHRHYAIYVSGHPNTRPEALLCAACGEQFTPGEILDSA